MNKTNEKVNVGMSVEEKAMDTSIMQDLDALIPEEERALATASTTQTEVSQPDIHASAVVVVEDRQLDELLPEEERAVIEKTEDDEVDKYQEAEDQGCFSIVNGMARIENVLDNQIYASVEVGKTGERTISFCQQYENGEFSPMVRVRQSDLLMAAACNFLEDKKGIPAVNARAKRFIMNCYADYLGKFAGEAPLDISMILKILVLVRNSLPTYYEKQDILSTPKALYQETVNIILGKGQYQRMYSYLDRKAYFGLDREQFEWLATDLNTDCHVLARKFKEYGFLYLTDASVGYQTKVWIGSSPMPEFKTPSYQNLYCILKLDYISEQRRLNGTKNP